MNIFLRFTEEISSNLLIFLRFLELGCGDLSFARSLLEQRRRHGSGGFHLTTSMLESPGCDPPLSMRRDSTAQY